MKSQKNHQIQCLTGGIVVKFLRNDQGMVLPITLFAILVLSLLGTALWHSSVAATLQTSRRQENMQAHYIARSGAEAVAQHLINHPEEAASLISATETNPATASIGNGSFRVHVRATADPNLLQIVSTGQSGMVSTRVILNLARERSRLDVFRGAITSTAPLDLSIATVTGDVYSAGEITLPKKFSGRYFEFQELDLPPISRPTLTSATCFTLLPALPLPTASGNHLCN